MTDSPLAEIGSVVSLSPKSDGWFDNQPPPSGLGGKAGIPKNLPGVVAYAREGGFDNEQEEARHAKRIKQLVERAQNRPENEIEEARTVLTAFLALDPEELPETPIEVDSLQKAMAILSEKILATCAAQAQENGPRLVRTEEVNEFETRKGRERQVWYCLTEMEGENSLYLAEAVDPKTDETFGRYTMLTLEYDGTTVDLRGNRLSVSIPLQGELTPAYWAKLRGGSLNGEEGNIGILTDLKNKNPEEFEQARKNLWGAVRYLAQKLLKPEEKLTPKNYIELKPLKLDEDPGMEPVKHIKATVLSES